MVMPRQLREFQGSTLLRAFIKVSARRRERHAAKQALRTGRERHALKVAQRRLQPGDLDPLW